MSTEHFLTVYRASAGSGKTFTLAVEYIKLLIQNPSSYRNILAVTFTNKATAEMKERILSQLYGIAHGLKSSDSYISVIQQKIEKEEGTAMPTPKIRERAQTALTNLLHNYNYFRVETIDTFFQSILRGLSRELNLSANMQIDIDQKQILTEAVDRLLCDLDREKDSNTFDWILDIVKEKIDEGKTWKIADELVKFGDNITKAYYLDNEEQLREVIEKGEIVEFKKKLTEIKRNAKEQIKDITDNYFQVLAQEGIAGSDFKRGIHTFVAATAGGSTKEAGPTVAKASESPEEWVAKNNKERARLLEIVESNCFSESLRMLTERIKTVRIADVNLRYLDKLQLIDKIDESVRSYNREANRFLLAETPGLLNKLIKASDAPFIYEKTGSIIEHIMIDEFQDTSITQWNNFRVLLDEAQATAQSCLIVGDIKQSIYRWRDGDWTILNNIEQTYPINLEHLDTNRRSFRHIIEFNNAFFKSVLEMPMPDVSDDDTARIKEAYSDVEQLIPEGKANAGYVSLQMIPVASSKKKNEEGDEEDDDKQNALKYLLEETRRLTESGIDQSDICFLVRKNSQASDIADYFAENAPEMKIVSDEAFRLSSSKTITDIINSLRLLNNPDDKLASEILGNVIPAAKLDEMKILPLLEQVEALYRYLSSQYDTAGEDAYVMCFIDAVQKYMNEQGADLGGFLKLWDKELNRKCIPSAQGDGIRIMTIHKAKGLEFHTVVIPYADTIMDTKPKDDEMLWCTPKTDVENELPIIPIGYGKKMVEAGYGADFEEEAMQRYVDCLNTLYVALTRPKANLIIQAENRKMLKNGPKTDTTTIFQAYYEEKKGELSGKQTEAYEYGELVRSEAKDGGEQTDNALLESGEGKTVGMVSNENLTEFRQSNASHDFINGKDDDKEYINRGLLLHRIFSCIKTESDIKPVIADFLAEGVIGSRKDCDNIERLIRNGLKNPTVADWFSGRYRLYNECDIIFRQKGKLHHRPDRVMLEGDSMTVVDFKFGSEKAAYAEQVKEYMGLLREMGYKNVKGYLWFVYKNVIKEVND
ncbi:MAG: UvrD-helicase domain-containing protein [Bacteroidaceae bacterium]|nr:UvrD-helicase domain-containing protein [Bacteroidaceae bacterium]